MKPPHVGGDEGSYPRGGCAERVTTVAGFRAVWVDFGAAGDVTPRFHGRIEVGGELEELIGCGDDFHELARELISAAIVVRKGLNELEG